MNPFRILTIIVAAGAVVAASGIAARAQGAADWGDWAKSSVDGISYQTRCGHVPPGRGAGKDFIVARFRNDGATDFTGWWSVSYNNADPAVTKKDESSRQKLALKAGIAALALSFSVVNLCLNSPAINVGT